LTLSSAEHLASPSLSRSGGAVCSLSDILETGGVPRRYYLSVKHAPCEAVCACDAWDNARSFPAGFRGFDALPGEQSQKACKVASGVARKDTGDVLPDQPLGPIAASNCTIDEHEVATLVIQALSEAGDAEGLARGAADKKVNCMVGPLLEFGHVAVIRHVRIVVGEQRRREIEAARIIVVGIELREERRLPAQRVPGLRCRLDAGAD
jgi:hypothetical protein